MQRIELIMGLLVAMAALAHLAQKIRIAYPILLVVGGTAISFIPHLPAIQLDPDLVFLLFLPPLLYYSGINTSWRDFKANLRPITLLAVGLVLATTVVIAIIARYFIDGMNWPAAFALGAIISPPDAIAASAIAQRLRIPKRVITILEGESLVNDATALVIYRFAVACTMSAVFSLPKATGEFFLISIGGILIGIAVGHIAAIVRARLNDPSVENIVSLLTPFVAYLPAEQLHVSGVLAAVAAGIVMSRKIPKVISFRTRLRAYAVWETLVFILNGLIFILIGLQLPVVLERLAINEGMHEATLLGYATIVCLGAILTRIAWVIPATYVPRMLFPKLRQRDPAPPFGQTFVVAWTGMRGIVSLAAAFALPINFPKRDLILFLAFAVILATLVLQGLTLPAIIRFFGLTDDGSEAREEHTARLEGAHAALARLEALAYEGVVPEQEIDQIRAPYAERVQRLAPKPDGTVADLEALCQPTCSDDVHRELIHAERRMVTFLRDEGVIGDDVLRRLHKELDYQEARLGDAE